MYYNRIYLVVLICLWGLLLLLRTRVLVLHRLLLGPSVLVLLLWRLLLRLLLVKRRLLLLPIVRHTARGWWCPVATNRPIMRAVRDLRK